MCVHKCVYTHIYVCVRVSIYVCILCVCGDICMCVCSCVSMFLYSRQLLSTINTAGKNIKHVSDLN